MSSFDGTRFSRSPNRAARAERFWYPGSCLLRLAMNMCLVVKIMNPFWVPYILGAAL